MKILFHYSRLNVGGAERSVLKLINLLASLHWDVTLVLNVGEGSLEPQLDSRVKVIKLFPKPWKLWIASQTSIVAKLKNALLFTLPIVYHSFKSLLKKNKLSSETFDAAIISLQGLDPYLVCNTISAKKKFLYLRSDLSKVKKNNIRTNILKYSPALDGFLCVSETVLNSLDSIDPKLKEKATVLYNITDKEEIKRLSNIEPNPYLGFKNVNNTILVTVCRMSDQSKGLFRQLEVAKALHQKGVSFSWFFIGDGIDLEQVVLKRNELGLIDKVTFLGEKQNPYPFMLHADIVCVLSYFEGLCGVVNEGKFLGKPVVATEFSGIREQLVHGENGLILAQDTVEIIQGLEGLIQNKEQQEALSNDYLGSDIGNNEKKVSILEQCIRQ